MDRSGPVRSRSEKTGPLTRTGPDRYETGPKDQFQRPVRDHKKKTAKKLYSDPKMISAGNMYDRNLKKE